MISSKEKRKYILFHERGLVGKFTDLWPSPRAIQEWITEKWKVPGYIYGFYCGKGFYVFIFSSKEERDLIFILGPYFMGSKGMFLSH
jgi:hypothetical protein